MKVAIIKYNAGNIQSVSFALQRLSVAHVITDDMEEIKRADKVIFPGVGEASSTMRYLRDRKLDLLIPALVQPVLGICLGMQLLCKHSEENNTQCLDVIDAPVLRFPVDKNIKVPHVGWNSLVSISEWIDPAVKNEHVYFVHGYYVPVGKFTAATTAYVKPFSAAIRKNNFYGVQFHPEKSGATGELILKSFLQQ